MDALRRRERIEPTTATRCSRRSGFAAPAAADRSAHRASSDMSAARVISFPAAPGHGASHRQLRASHTAPRWIAQRPRRPASSSASRSARPARRSGRRHVRRRVTGQAAVAWSPLRPPSAPTHGRSQSPRDSAAPDVAATPEPDIAADDAFLSDLEIALERPRTRELQPFDALTPHVREYGSHDRRDRRVGLAPHQL